VAIDKNFVVKNGLEVNNNLILADATAKKVGISSLNPRYTLDVAGGIGATDLYVVGVSTVLTEFNIGANGTTLTGVGGSIGIGTITPAFLLDVRSPVSTGKTAIFARGDAYITGTLTSDDLTSDSANVNALNVANTTTLGGSLSVTGLSTFSNSVTISGNVSASGISTFNNQVNLSNNLQVSGVSTLSTLAVTGTSTTRNLQVTGVSTLSSLGVTGPTTTQSLQVSGISTLGTVQISSGIVTATSGIVTYYGDGRFLNISNNSSTGIGIGTTGGLVGYGITFLDLKGAGVSTTFYNSNVGIATIFFEGGGSGTIGIGTIFPTTFAGNGDLFYHIDYGRIFVYYDEFALGIGSTAFWVDAAPFNIGIIDIDELSLSKLTVTGSAGVVKSGIGSTALIVEGDTRITGILTVGSSSLTLNGNTNQINGVTISSGIITATAIVGNLFGNATGLSGSPNISINNITGTAATFSGNVTVGGTLTYEDVTNIDSIGLVTARSGVRITSGGLNVVGVTTSTGGFVGNLTGNASGLSGTPNISVGVGTFSGGINLSNLLREDVNIVAGKLSDNTNIDLANGMVHLFTTTETTTSTPNIRYNSTTTLNSVMSIGDTVAVTLITTAATAAYSSNITIDGNAVTERWLTAAAPTSGGSSGLDVYAFQIIKTASNTYTVLASVSNFA